MEGKENKDGEGKSSFFKRKASRKALNAQEAQAQDNLCPSSNHLSASVKSSTLPANPKSQNACAISPSSSGGIFSKLKRKLKLRSSRGKYDLKDIVPPTTMRRKSDDPNVMKEGRDGDHDYDDDLKITSSLKTPRRSHSDKEDVILIRKNKRVSVMCQSGDQEPEVIFSNAINSEDDESESFGEGLEEDPYATINSVKDKIMEKLHTPDAKMIAEKLERDRTKARELLSNSMKECSNENSRKVSQPVDNIEDLYAKIKPKKKDPKSDFTDMSDHPGLRAPLHEPEVNCIAEARLKSRLEPEYETLDDVRQRTSLMHDGFDDGYEDLSYDLSVFEESNPSIPVDPDYETLEDVKQRVEQCHSSSASSKADTSTTAHRQSTSHYSRPFDSKSSKHSGSIRSTSLSSFSTSDRSPGEWTGGSKESKLDNSLRESPLSKKISSSQEKMDESDADMNAFSAQEINQQTQKGPAPLAASIDTFLPAEESASSSSECIYDNPNVILRKQLNRDSLSPLSPKSRCSSHIPSQKTSAEEELVEKLSSLLAPPLPLRNYMKDEVSRGAGSSRHSWASPSPKFWDMSESWHGSDLKRGDHFFISTPSVDARQKMSNKSKSQELFEAASNVRKSTSRERPKVSEMALSKEEQNVNDGPESQELKLEIQRSVSPQVRIIPISKSPAFKSSIPASGSEEHAVVLSEMEAKASQSVTPLFRIIPISLSPGSPIKASVSSSSSGPGSNESSKDQSERATLDKDENYLKLRESASEMQEFVSEEITEAANESWHLQMLSKCHQKLSSNSQAETKPLLVKRNSSSVGEGDDVCSDSENGSLLCNSSGRECNSDEKTSSFISSAVMELHLAAGLDECEKEYNTGGLSSGKARISTIHIQCDEKGNGTKFPEVTDKEASFQISQKFSNSMDGGQSSTPVVRTFRSRSKNEQSNRVSPPSDSSEVDICLSNTSKNCTNSVKPKRIPSPVYDSVKVDAEIKPSLVQSESEGSDAIDETNNFSLLAKKGNKTKRCHEHRVERASVRNSVEVLKSLRREVEANSFCNQVQSVGSHHRQIRYQQHSASSGQQNYHSNRPLDLDINTAGTPLCSDLLLLNHAQTGARPHLSPSSSRTSSSARHSTVSVGATRYSNLTEGGSNRHPPLGREQIDLERTYAQLSSDNDSDPLGDLEQYDENAPGLYPSDSSDDFMKSRQLDPPQMDYMRRHHKKRIPKVEARSKRSRYHRSNSFSDNDDDFEDRHDLVFMDRDPEPDRLYPVNCSSKSKPKDPYPYNCYKLRDFEFLPSFKDVEFDIRNILLGRPILLENIINGHFCSFVGLNPYYFIRGSFEWTRIFALPQPEMRRVEKKLCSLFNHIQASLHRSNYKLPRQFQNDEAYWLVVDYLKKVQDQPTFNNIRIHLLGTDELLSFGSFFRNFCTLPQILDRFIKVEDFRVNEEEFKISREAAPTDGNQDSPRHLNFQRCIKVERQQDPNENDASPRLEKSDDSRQAQKNMLSHSHPSPSFGGFSINLLTDFFELCDSHNGKISSGQDSYDSDEDEENETMEIYMQSVAISFAEARHHSFESAAAIMSLCRAFRGELAYTAEMRRKGKGVKKLASWTCSGMDSHLSFSAWEEMDQLMKKLVPHISPRLDFQYLLRLYAEFKFFILKDRQRNKQCRGCFFVNFESGIQCCKKEEFVFLKLLRYELCYFSRLIRGCAATESLFLEEHSVAYSLTRLLTLVFETLWKMNQSMLHHPVDNADNVQASDPTEPFSSLKDFDYHHERMGPWNLSIRDKIFFHVANYKAFRTSSMWHDLQAWQQPSDFLDDPNLLQGNSSVFTHADNAIHVAHFGGYEDLKPLHEREGFTESMQQLRMKEWYWGPLSYEQATLVLKDHRDGTFLVRDSSDKKYLLSLSFISLGEVHHTRIEHAKGLFSFWSQPESHTKGSICEFIDISVQNSKDGRFLYFLRPNDRGTPPIPIRLLYPLSRNYRVPSLKHLSRFLIRQSVRIDHIKRLPLPQKVKAYLLEKQYFVEILMDDSWAFEREGSVSM